MGHTLSLQERAHVLRLVLTHLQKVVNKGSLDPDTQRHTWRGVGH